MTNNDVVQNSSPAEAADVSGMSIGQVLRILLHRWWLIALLTAGVFGVAWKIVAEDRTVYQAAAVLRFLDAPEAVPRAMGPQVLENPRSSEFLITQINVLRSRTVLGDVVDRQGLRVRPAAGLNLAELRAFSVATPETAGQIQLQFAPEGFIASTGGTSVRAAYGGEVEVGGVRFTIVGRPNVETAQLDVYSRETAITMLSSSLNAIPRERSAILDISIQDPDPARAVATVNAVAQAYQSRNAQDLQEQARKTREFTEMRLLEARAEVARAQASLANFRRAAASVNAENRAQVQLATQTELERERAQREKEFVIYSDFARRVENASGEQIDNELRMLMASPDVSSGLLLSSVYSQIVDYDNQLTALRADRRPTDSPEVQRLTTLINSARASVIEAARIQLSSTSAAITKLQERIAQNAAIPVGNFDLETQQANYTRELSFAEGSLLSARTEYERARMAEAVGLAQVAILDYATVPTPLKIGDRQRRLIIALFLGLLLGCGGALGLEAADTRIRKQRDSDALLTVPQLGLIPSFEPTPEKRFRRFLPGHSAGARQIEQASSEPPVTFLAAEAYRRLRTNLAFLDSVTKVQTLVVTSSLPGEGKTTTAANLAVAFAQEGRRVLLVDGDLRRPRLHQIFESKGAAGFADVLLNRVNGSGPDPARPIEGLDFLPSGEYDPRAAEVLSGSRMNVLLDGFKDAYDLIIFDTAPVLLAYEAAVLAGLADGVLLVVRAGTSRQQPVREALQQLDAVHANVVGFVMNDPEAVAADENSYTYTREYYSVEAS